MYLPDDNGDFNLNSQEDITFSTLVVEGPSPQALESSVVQSPTTLSSAVPYHIDIFPIHHIVGLYHQFFALLLHQEKVQPST